MSDVDESQGPMMLAATTLLRPPPARVGKIGKNISLPRTVQLSALIWAVAGALVFGLVGVLIFGLRGFIMGGMLGGAGGWLLITYSPLKDETLLKWLGLNAKWLNGNRVELDGVAVQMYIGMARITRVAAGHVAVQAGAVNVNPDDYDERGVLRTASNHNVEAVRSQIKLDRPEFQPLDTFDMPAEVVSQVKTQAVSSGELGRRAEQESRAAQVDLRAPAVGTSGPKFVMAPASGSQAAAWANPLDAQEPGRVPGSGPAPSPVPGPQPAPVPQPSPGPVPVPQPIPQPDPIPGPQPVPVPGPLPTPSPMPLPGPMPMSVPSNGAATTSAENTAGDIVIPAEDERTEEVAEEVIVPRKRDEGTEGWFRP